MICPYINEQSQISKYRQARREPRTDIVALNRVAGNGGRRLVLSQEDAV